MTKPKMLVTGATGGTGLVVVAELLAKGFPVRAMEHAAQRGEQALGPDSERTLRALAAA